MANLRYFAVEDLLPAESLRNPEPGYRLDDNWALRGLRKDYVGRSSFPLPRTAGLSPEIVPGEPELIPPTTPGLQIYY